MNRVASDCETATMAASPSTTGDNEIRISRWKELGCVLLLVAFLAVYFMPFMLRNGASYQIGNDFSILYANYATYFVDALRAGFLPWWNPNEGGGYPFYSNPFTAFFYPGRVLSLLIAAGSPVYGAHHHQIYTVLGIMLLAIGYYVWLRGRCLDPAASLFAAGAIAIGYRIADIDRFPNAIHAAAWMPWILFAYDRWIERELGRGLLLGIFAIVCMTTAGYPYYACYAAMLLAGYVVLRMVEGVPVRRALVALVLLVTPAVLIVLPYVESMGRVLQQTVDRSGGNYEYGVSHPWFFADLVGGLVFPPSAMSEGWLYCGVLPVLLVATWAVLCRPRSAAFFWAMAIIFLVQLFAMADHSFLFPALWSFVPGFSSLRVWPRMTIVMLPPLALCIAMAYTGLARHSRHVRLMQGAVWRVAIVVLGLQILLWTTKTFSSYYTSYFSFMTPNTFVMATIVAAVFAVLWSQSSRRVALYWSLAALIVTASDTGVFGRRIWLASIGSPAPEVSLDLPGYYAHFFETPRLMSSAGMQIPYTPTAGLLGNWYYGRYAAFLAAYSAQPGFSEFLGDHGRKIFFSSTLDAPPAAFADWWRNVAVFEQTAQATAQPMPHYNGNVLTLRYRSALPGYLIFVDNWDEDWRALLNGRAVPIERAFGTFKAVKVPPGSGTVTFEYHPRLPYYGATVAGLLFAAVVVWSGMRRRRALTRPEARPPTAPTTPLR